jgi:hypothetical protein
MPMEFGLGLDFDFPVSLQQVLWICIALALCVYAVMSLIFHHHWSYYGISTIERVAVVAIFHLFSLIFLSVSVLATLALGTV